MTVTWRELVNLFERTDAKLKVAVKFIEDLRQSAIENQRTKLVERIDKCLAEIKKI